jgi:phage shock protein PspC (stress-responsive transcriptional regulator)
MVAAGAARHARDMSEHTVTTPRLRRLERSRDNKILAGVCSGLGRYFDIAPAVFRLGFVVLTLLGGSGILVYIAAVIVMPKEGEETSIAEDVLRKRRDHPVRLIALGLIAVAILSLLVRADTWPSTGAAWFLVFLAGLTLLWTSGRRGIVVAVTAVLAVFVAALVAAAAVAFIWFNVSLGDGVGNRTYTPATAADVSRNYDLGVGNLKIDLSELPAAKSVDVHAHLGVGDLRIVLPARATVSLTSHVKAGSIDALGRHEDGMNPRVDTRSGGLFTIDAEVGAGHLEVMRAQ